MHITILYFGPLRELAGKNEEIRELGQTSPEALYSELQELYQFPHRFKGLQVAVNHVLSSHQAELKDGDTIAFLPPMAGG